VADRRRRWFGVVSGDLKLGGTYKIEGNAGGTITECVPRERIAVTWEFGGGVTWVNVRLTAEERGARLEVEHVAVVDPRWGQFGPGAVGIGWDLWFMGLARHFESPAAEAPPESVDTWFTTDEAKNVIRIAGDGWAQAAMAAGEDEAIALASAETTRKFYTGETPPEH
ncbi:MAG: SRPBCC domain-containing protein, partial [Devosia sp.]